MSYLPPNILDLDMCEEHRLTNEYENRLTNEYENRTVYFNMYIRNSKRCSFRHRGCSRVHTTEGFHIIGKYHHCTTDIGDKKNALNGLFDFYTDFMSTKERDVQDNSETI